METLDGVMRAIPPECLLICDSDETARFAGVMGEQPAVSEVP